MAEIFTPQAMDLITPVQRQQQLNTQQAQQQQTAQNQQQTLLLAQQEQARLTKQNEFDRTFNLYKSMESINPGSGDSLIPELEKKGDLEAGTFDVNKIRGDRAGFINNVSDLNELSRGKNVEGFTSKFKEVAGQYGSERTLTQLKSLQAVSPEIEGKRVAQSRFQDKVDLVKSAITEEKGRPATSQEVLERVEQLTSETPAETEDKAKRKAEVKRVGDLKVKLPKARNTLVALERQWSVMENTIDEAIKLVDPFKSGIGTVFSVIPATQAKTLQGKLNTIRANVGFDKLQDMRNNSPTGGALGQVSEFENVLLQSVLGSLDQTLEAPELISNLNIVKENIANMRRDRNKAFDLDFGEVLPKDNIAVRETVGTGDITTVQEGTIIENASGDRQIMRGGKWQAL